MRKCAKAIKTQQETRCLMIRESVKRHEDRVVSRENLNVVGVTSFLLFTNKMNLSLINELCKIR